MANFTRIYVAFVNNFIVCLQFKLISILQHPSWEINPSSTCRRSGLKCLYSEIISDAPICTPVICSAVQCKVQFMHFMHPSLAVTHMSMAQLCVWGFFIGALSGSFRPCIAQTSLLKCWHIYCTHESINTSLQHTYWSNKSQYYWNIFVYLFFSISGMCIGVKSNVVLSFLSYRNTICKIFNLMLQS